MPIRFLLLLLVLASTGCATSPTPQEEVARVLDEWKAPSGLSDAEIIERENRVLQDNPTLHISPFVFPDFTSLRRIDALIEKHGYQAVYDALATEIQDRKRLRVNRALTLLAHIDPTDSWIDVYSDEPYPEIEDLEP